MSLFKSMTNRQMINWKKGAIVGFYTYLILLFVNYTHNLIFTDDFFSSAIIFWSGLIVAFGYEIVLNLNDKRKIRKNLE
ncbi:hypothetical protein ABFG93_00495 [Pseudalkalibacillus hwajinpoensis]|uniref:hypothetical protein n=1 Tax=Guptibacillus hwajinpoensis TaxID=208199 RepID=UPI00325A845B